MRLYLETTVPNFRFADDAPDKRRTTEVFFGCLRVASDELFVSTLVEDEIAACTEPKRSQMISVLEDTDVHPAGAGSGQRDSRRPAQNPAPRREDWLGQLSGGDQLAPELGHRACAVSAEGTAWERLPLAVTPDRHAASTEHRSIHVHVR